MTVAEARTEIEVFTQAVAFPTLTASEVDLLLRQAKRASQPFQAGALTGQPLNNNVMPVIRQGTVPPDTFAEWAALTVYALGDEVVPTERNGHHYVVTTAGTSGAPEPDFPTVEAATVGDGTVVWTEDGAALWVPTFALAPSIARGWKLKASKVAGAYDFATDDQRFSRSQVYRAMLEMAKFWANASAGSLELLGSLRERRVAGVPVGNNDWLWNDDDEPLAGPSQGLAVRNVGGGRTLWTDELG